MPPDLTVRTPTLDIGYVTDGVSFLHRSYALIGFRGLRLPCGPRIFPYF